jgi:dTDP-4-dehydrorhamnose 3,5-epimerase
VNVTPTALKEVLLLTPRIFGDDRGAFWETWNRRDMAELGIPVDWVQDNSSWSRKHVVRGIHYQVIHPQAKLVRVTYGRVLDVAVDLRRSSPDFGRHVAVELSAESGQMLYLPVGFGHGFLVLSDFAGFAYKVSDYYSPQGERTIAWNDPDLSISWPIHETDAVVSDKDSRGSRLRNAEVFA